MASVGSCNYNRDENYACVLLDVTSDQTRREATLILQSAKT